jgi:RNA-directed DNA polymerase
MTVPVLEDKIVQRATVEVMNAIYEIDFKGFSYGFRSGRSQHDALDAVSLGIYREKVSWVLDADIVGFFDALSHDWLIKFIKHRINDERVIRHIKKWLNAGVMEGNKVIKTGEGTPQGGSISPLLANLYLHYVFDLWADKWRKKEASGDVIIVRYADDFVVGFQHEHEAKAFLRDLKERLARFALELHPRKRALFESAASRPKIERNLVWEALTLLTFLVSRTTAGKTRLGSLVSAAQRFDRDFERR